MSFLLTLQFVTHPSSSVWRSSLGRLFGAGGEQPFIGSTLSSAFPLVNHPAFGAIYTAGAGRPEFGGLGSLGMSAALAAHPQLGALSGETRPPSACRRGRASQQPLLSSLLSLQSGGELPRPTDEEPLPSSPPSSASLRSSARTFSPTTAPVPYRSGRRARTATARPKVPHRQLLLICRSCSISTLFNVGSTDLCNQRKCQN